ncbi:MAG TPA: hypothetical protein DCX27_08590 [Balneola sp.]|nr:hypothetical protein [Balneola sp.]
MLAGDSCQQAQSNVARLGLPALTEQTLAVWQNIYLPVLRENRFYAASVASGTMSMSDVITSINKRMKG